MITKFINYKLITEDPDYIEDIDYKTSYRVSDQDAIPFTCYVNENHTEVTDIHFGDNSEYHNKELDSTGTYPGRIWTESKIIAFWVYPNNKLFKSFIKKAEEILGFKFFNNGWRMEIQVSKKEK